MAKVFLINLKNATRKIRCVEAELRTGKQCWAVRVDGQRHLLGSSAFFTKQAACRARLGLLLKLTKDTYILRWFPSASDFAAREIKAFMEQGPDAWQVLAK